MLEERGERRNRMKDLLKCAAVTVGEWVGWRRVLEGKGERGERRNTMRDKPSISIFTRTRTRR